MGRANNSKSSAEKGVLGMGPTDWFAPDSKCLVFDFQVGWGQTCMFKGGDQRFVVGEFAGVCCMFRCRRRGEDCGGSSCLEGWDWVEIRECGW